MSETTQAPPFTTWAESNHAAASIVCEMLGAQNYFDKNPDHSTDARKAQAWDEYLARMQAWDERRPS